MRQQDDVVEPPERMIRRQRLDAEDIEGRAGDALSCRCRSSAASSTIGPREVLIRYGASASSAPVRGAPIRPRVRSDSFRWIDTTVGTRQELVLLDAARAPLGAPPPASDSGSRPAPPCRACVPKRAICAPSEPRPSRPSVLPCRPTPSVVCQRPVPHRAVLVRDMARERDHQAERQFRGGEATNRRCRRPGRRARSRHRVSIATFHMAAVTSSLSCGRLSNSARGNLVRSRTIMTTSKGLQPLRQAIDVGNMLVDGIDLRPGRRAVRQSAMRRATFW